MNISNLFTQIPEILEDEVFEDILNNGAFKLERIVSKGHATPEGEWYDQENNEWVILLKGSAGLLIEGEDTPMVLNAGDYINLPAHKKHRVEWTDPTTETIWLALHY